MIWEEAKGHIDTLLATAKPEMLDKLDLADAADANQKRTFIAVIKLRLKSANKQTAWQIRDLLTAKIEEVNYRIGQKKPYVRLEVEPPKRALNKQAGAWHGMCEEIGLTKTSYKLEYQKQGGKDAIVVMRKLGGRPARMAMWSDPAGWDVIEERVLAQVLAALEAEANGLPAPPLTVSVVLLARSRLRRGGATGMDDAAVDMFLNLSIASTYHVAELFQERYSGGVGQPVKPG